jgi:hypothetical protein
MTSRQRKAVKLVHPTPQQEEASFIRSLEKHGQAVAGKGPLPPGATHRLTIAPSGAKRVKRKRFSAV